MKTTFISKEKNDVKFSMEFSAEEFENAQIKAYQATKDQFAIDGFRKGKAPRSIIEKKYGEGIFFEDAIDNLFSDNYAEAIKELDIEVVARPRAEFSEIKKGQGFTITITVECFPEMEIKDYKGIKLEKDLHEVKEDDVDREIETLRKRNARMVTVDREAKEGDSVLFDYAGFVGEEQFEGGTAEQQTLKLGSGMFIPGFEEQLVGHKAGEKVDVTVTFPEEYHAPELAGKEAVFHCDLHEVKEEQLPDVDDDFAQDVSEYDTLAELKEKTKEKLENYAKSAAENEMKDAGIKAVVEANEIACPDQMVEDELDRMAQELDQQLSYSGMNLDAYLGYVQKDYAEFRNELRPDAEKSVKSRIALMNIANQEKLTVTDAELDAEMEKMGAQYGMELAKIKEMIGEDGLQYFKKDLVAKKAIDFIFDNAVIEEKKEGK